MKHKYFVVIIILSFLFNLSSGNQYNPRDYYLNSELSIRLNKIQIRNCAIYHKVQSYNNGERDKKNEILTLISIISNDINDLKENNPCSNSLQDYISNYIRYLAECNSVYIQLFKQDNIRNDKELLNALLNLHKRAMLLLPYKEEKNKNGELSEQIAHFKKIGTHRNAKIEIRKNINYTLKIMLQELHKISRLDANVSVKENMINIVLQDSLKKLDKFIKMEEKLSSNRYYCKELQSYQENSLNKIQLLFERENIIIHKQKASYIRRILLTPIMRTYFMHNSKKREHLIDILYPQCELCDDLY